MRAVQRWLLVVLLVVTTVVPLLPTGQAEAFAGRAKWHGYFSNILDTNGGGCRGGASAGDVLCDGLYPGGPTPQEDFLNQLWADLTYAGGWGAHNQTGAAFIVLTMLGYPVPTPGTRDAMVTQAASVFWTDFARAVRYYHSRGWVVWNSWASGYVHNTYWQGSPGPDDVAWYESTVSSESILFFNPDTGGNYFIRKECGNPLGAMNALVVPADYDVSLTASALTSENGTAPYKVVAGRTYSLGGTITNNGPGDSDPGLLQVLKPGAVCSPNPATCPLTQSNVPAGGVVYVQSYEPAWPGWSWTTSPLIKGGNITFSMNFTPTGAPGTSFVMDVYYGPANRAGEKRHVAIPYVIVSDRAPGISGTNSDIHAGGNICKQGASAPGVVKGFPGGSSVGEYVVSSSVLNGINNFKTNGTGADRLRLGNNGDYALVCRPDLVAAATAYQSAGVGFATISGSTDVASLNPAYDVFIATGPVSLHGTISRKITIAALGAGDVTIDGPLTINNAVYAPRQAPSLGIIAKNNINIVPGVTRVDAYLFSNATINTCSGVGTACATSQLVINGFVMARDLVFNRIGPLNSSGTPVSELVSLNPQIYLNPPKLFDASIDDLLLQGQGERQPLF